MTKLHSKYVAIYPKKLNVNEKSGDAPILILVSVAFDAIFENIDLYW